MILILHIIKAYPKSMLKRYIISNYIKIINNLHFKFIHVLYHIVDISNIIILEYVIHKYNIRYKLVSLILYI